MHKYEVEYKIKKTPASSVVESVTIIAEGLCDLAERWRKYAIHIALCDGVSLDDIAFVKCEDVG